MISIHTNLSSLITQSNLKQSSNGLNQAIERMSTGYKINSAKDNAANHSITTQLTTKINAFQMAENNTFQALDMLTTASESLTLMENLANRLRSIAMSASNINNFNSINALNSEATSIISELYRIKDNTTYNGINLLESFTEVPDGAGADVKNLKSKNSTFIDPVVKEDTTTMDRLEDVADDAVISGSVKYSISTPEELAKLAKMSNNSQIIGGTFVLASDIDLSAYSTGEGFEVIAETGGFKGVVNGNGYVIRNLYINRPNSSNVALIGGAHVKVINLGLENVEIIGKSSVGGIVGSAQMNNLKNCYVSCGTITGSGYHVGGLAGDLSYTSVDKCWTDVEVVGNNDVGGLIGYASVNVKNSYALGNVSGKSNVGGLIGISSNSTSNSFSEGNVNVSGNYGGGIVGNASTNYGKIENCTVYGSILGAGKIGVVVGTANGTTINNVLYSKSSNKDIAEIGSGGDTAVKSAILGVNFQRITSIQVGINSAEYSNISIALGVSDISKIDSILGCIENENSLFEIDKLIKLLTERQTEIGSVQNRLLSTLEEVSTQYESLISACSTIRDADIADESSEYIKMQILQQASATLLATANQTPAIALQLI